ncbi:MAG: NUDIX hydrolase [Chlamydiae bacterium]|nr:NUDIX hydrolase [Chlamydiota bacterium]
MNSTNYTFFSTIPPFAQPSCEVSGCFFLFENRFLLLKRHEDKPQGNTWCLPAGKKEKHESPLETVIREVQEEIGYNLMDSSLLEKIGSVYIHFEQNGLIFHIFGLKLSSQPEFTLKLDEHTDLCWVDVQQAKQLNLIMAGIEVLELCHKQMIPADLPK